MDENVAQIARATAAHFDPRVATEVEAALHADGQAQYVDPVAIASLIVSIASLAWTIYADLRKANPAKETLARAIRLEMSKTQTITTTTRQIIEVVVDETLDHLKRG